MKKIIVLLLFIIVTVNMVSAEEIKKIDMESAINIALSKNVMYQSKKKDLEIAEKNIKIANRLKNPQLFSHTLIGRVTRSNNSQLGINLPVEVLKRGARKNVAIAEYNKAKTELEQYEYNLKIDVMEAYFEVLCAKSYVILMERKEYWYKNILEIAANKKNTEPRYEVDVLRARIKHERELIDLNYLRSNVNEAICNFNKVLNTNERDITYDTIEASLRDNSYILNIKLPSYDKLVDFALKNNFELKLSRDDIKIADKNITLTKRQRVPDLYLAGGYAYQKMSVHDPYQGAYVTAGMDFPILYTYRPEIDKSKIILDRLKYNKVAYEDLLNYTIQDNYYKFNAHKNNMENAQKIYNDMDRLLTLESEAYKKNEIRLMDLMNIEDSQQHYMTEFFESIHLFYKAYLNLLRNLGKNFDELL
jgi:outer membrane protein TolC